jgi:hypothetical protein
VDYLDLQANRLMSGHFLDVVKECTDVPIEMFASTDESQGGTVDGASKIWVPTFDGLLSTTGFVKDMREILRVLHEAYEYPVDVEFTLNFVDGNSYRIHVVQCRPLPVKGIETPGPSAMEVSKADTIIEASGAVIGHGRHIRINRFIYIVPSAYSQLPLQDRHEIAKLLGQINQGPEPFVPGAVMLLGPGRWGSNDPFLGVPVVFSQISRTSVLCEIVAMHENLVPDVSLGTHFLNELVETDMLYLALFPRRGNNYLRTEWFESAPNRLVQLVPKAGRWADVVKVIEPSTVAGEGSTFLIADALKQRVLCYFER